MEHTTAQTIILVVAILIHIGIRQATATYTKRSISDFIDHNSSILTPPLGRADSVGPREFTIELLTRSSPLRRESFTVVRLLGYTAQGAITNYYNTMRTYNPYLRLEPFRIRSVTPLNQPKPAQ